MSADWEKLLGFHENLAVGCRCMGFSNEQYQCDDGHHIRDHGDQVRGYHIALGCQGTDTTAKSEQQTRLGRALRGENLPKITAAMAMKPCPTITLGRNWLMVARVTNAPPSPARNPDRITQV